MKVNYKEIKTFAQIRDIFEQIQSQQYKFKVEDIDNDLQEALFYDAVKDDIEYVVKTIVKLGFKDYDFYQIIFKAFPLFYKQPIDRRQDIIKTIGIFIHTLIDLKYYDWSVKNTISYYDASHDQEFLVELLKQDYDTIRDILNQSAFLESDLTNAIFDNLYKEQITRFLNDPDNTNSGSLKEEYKKWLAGKAVDTSLAFRGSGLPALAVENIFSRVYDTDAMSLYELMSVIGPVTTRRNPGVIGAGNKDEFIDV